MIGIKAISSYVPKEALDNIERAKKFGESEDFIRNKIGALHLPIKDPNQETSDIAVLAIQSLLDKNPALNLSSIDTLIVVTQNPDGEGLPHTAAIIQTKLGMPTSVAAFDISLGCSGYVHALYAIHGFLSSSGLQNGILVTADPYSKVVDYEDKVTSLLFGDAATATWLGNNPVWELGEVAYGTNGDGAEFLKVSSHRLSMNGRQVFNFALSKVAPHIKEVLNKADLTKEDVDLYCLHQGSAAIVDAIAKNFENVSNRFVKDMENTGNTISSSIPLLLEKYAFDNNLQRIIISGFGVGMSWATALIKKVE